MGNPTYAADTTASSATLVTSTPTNSDGVQSVPARAHVEQTRARPPAANSDAFAAAALSLRRLAGGQPVASVEPEADQSPESLETVYACFDDIAVIRTTPNYTGTNATIPDGTRVTLVSNDGHNAEVRMPSRTYIWTRRSNLQQVRQEIAAARIDAEKLEAVAVSVVAMVPELVRSNLETAVREVLTSSVRMGVTDALLLATVTSPRTAPRSPIALSPMQRP
jgi:hypothetical protein